MEKPAEKKSARIRVPSLIFIIFVVLAAAGIFAWLIFGPLDEGILAPATVSSNLSYGGHVAYVGDYTFYRGADGSLWRYYASDGTREQVQEGQAKYINPTDGFVYYLDGGAVFRTPYYGLVQEKIGDFSGVSAMSVNGSWIYYTDENGILYKMRTDGSSLRALTDGIRYVKEFSVDNRVVVYTDGSVLWGMQTDGSETLELDRGNITRIAYTLDDLYYCCDGVIKRIPSLVSNQSTNREYKEIQADVFALNSISGQGILYYLGSDGIYKRLLATEMAAESEDVRVSDETDFTELSFGAEGVYCYTSSGACKLLTVDSENVGTLTTLFDGAGDNQK